MKKKVIIFLQAAFFYILFILVGYSITGRIERKHPVLPNDTTVIVNNKKYKVQELVTQYQPTIYTSINSPEPKSIQYELAEGNEEFIVVYHAEWEDEKHPNLIQDFAWRIFRFAYFGFTFKDSEYIQINIDKQTGKITRAMFDSSKESGFSIWAHDLRKTTKIKLLKDNIYQVFEVDDNSEELEREFELQKNALQLAVSNWNHLFILEKSFEGKNKIDVNLAYLNAEDYKWYKYARRHHGEIFTPKSPANTPIIFFASIIFITYLVIILRDYALTPEEKSKRKKNA